MREHVKISNAAKFQSCWPNTREMVDICENKRQMYGSQTSLPMPDCHTFVSYFWVFQLIAYHSACVWQIALKLG